MYPAVVPLARKRAKNSDGKDPVEFLKAQVAKNPLLLDAAIKTHAHLDVKVVNYQGDRYHGDRIRPGKGPSLPESLSLRRVLEAIL